MENWRRSIEELWRDLSTARIRRWQKVAATVLALLALSAFTQPGGTLAAVVISYLALVVLAPFPSPLVPVTVVLTGVAIVAWWQSEVSDSRLVDIVIVAGSLGLVIWLLYRYPSLRRASTDQVGSRWLARLRQWTRTSTAAVLLTLALAWVASSSLDLLRDRKSLIGQSPSGSWSRGTGLPIGLALSGGGYRAALFHAGVLRAVDAQRIRVRAVSAVSGGAIAGSYYVAGGNPDTLLLAVIGRRFNMMRELSRFTTPLQLIAGHQLPFTESILVFPWRGPFYRTDVQANILNRNFLRSMTLDELAGDDRPALLLNTTDLVAGSLIGLSAGGVIVGYRRPSRGQEEGAFPERDSTISGTLPGYFPPGTRSLGDCHAAKLIAASGGFPGAFNTTPIQVKAEDGRSLPLYLSDGGLTDNSGLTLLRIANYLSLLDSTMISSLGRQYPELIDLNLLPDSAAAGRLERWRISAAIVSDASGISERQSSIRRSWLAEIAAAAGVVYGAASPGPFAPATVNTELPVLRISPADLLRNAAAVDTLMASLKRSDIIDPERFPYVVDGARKSGANNDFISLDDSALTVVLERMHPQQRDSALALVKVRGRNRDGRGSTTDSMLYTMVLSELNEWMWDFIEMPTLEDTPSAAAADHVFRLGQFLTMLKARDLSCLSGVAEASTLFCQRARARDTTYKGNNEKASRLREAGKEVASAERQNEESLLRRVFFGTGHTGACDSRQLLTLKK